MSSFIEAMGQRIIESGLASKSDLKGCSEADIFALEEYFALRLPNAYKDFLRLMGRGAGLFMDGTDVFYDRLFENRTTFEEVLELDKRPFVLEHRAFVFSSHQGYIFMFFDTSDDREDPLIFGYKEGDLEPRVIAESFSAFIGTALAEEVEAWKSVRTNAS